MLLATRMQCCLPIVTQYPATGRFLDKRKYSSQVMEDMLMVLEHVKSSEPNRR